MQNKAYLLVNFLLISLWNMAHVFECINNFFVVAHPLTIQNSSLQLLQCIKIDVVCLHIVDLHPPRGIHESKYMSGWMDGEWVSEWINNRVYNCLNRDCANLTRTFDRMNNLFQINCRLVIVRRFPCGATTITSRLTEPQLHRSDSKRSERWLRGSCTWIFFLTL